MKGIRNTIAALVVGGAVGVAGGTAIDDNAPASPGVGIEVICRDGWTPDPLPLIDAVALRCVQDDRTVIVDERGEFQRGWTGDMPSGEFVTDPAAMPGWE